MVDRIANIVLLVEDINQENLLRRYLQRCGHVNRNMRTVKLPSGQGSAEQFVRERYASEVRTIRTKLALGKACLITMIDADIGSTSDRLEQLQRALQQSEESPRGPSEPILILIPKRNVETWILCLSLMTVDEESNYRRDPRVNAGSIKQAASTLFDWTRPNNRLPVSCVPSLQACLSEFHRLNIYGQ